MWMLQVGRGGMSSSPWQPPLLCPQWVPAQQPPEHKLQTNPSAGHPGPIYSPDRKTEMQMIHSGSIISITALSLKIWVWEGFPLCVFHTDLGHPPLLLREGSASPKLRALRFWERKRTGRSPAADSAISTPVSSATGLSADVTLLFFFCFQLNRFVKGFISIHSF